MMDITGVFFQWFIIFFDRISLASVAKSEIMSNQCPFDLATREL